MKTPTNITASGMVKLSQLIGPRSLLKTLNIAQWTENFQHCATDFMCDERVCCVFMIVFHLLEVSDNRITGYYNFIGSGKRNNCTELIFFHVLICFTQNLGFRSRSGLFFMII